LDGSGSKDPDGNITSYSWIQTAGPSVTLNGADTKTASFTAPSVSSDTILKFSLTVKDNKGTASINPAIVSVTVKAAIPSSTAPATSNMTLAGNITNTTSLPIASSSLNFTGSVPVSVLNMTDPKSILSYMHLAASDAALEAQKATGDNSSAVTVNLRIINGFLVSVVEVIDAQYNTHEVVIDVGNEKILSIQTTNTILASIVE
jgi:hypothetical protein